MRAAMSGLAECVADDDAHATGLARERIAALGWKPAAPSPDGPAPKSDADDLLGLFGDDMKQPVEMRHVIARIVDGSEFLEFKPDFGPATICGFAAITGFRVGLITNNGPLDPAGS